MKDGPLTKSIMRGKTALSKDRLDRLLDRMEFEKKVTWLTISAKGNNCRQYWLTGTKEPTLSVDVVGLSVEIANVEAEGVGCGPIT